MPLAAPCLSNPSRQYKRHCPEKTLLYQIVQENLFTFYQQIEREYENGLPNFVKKEFEKFLKCGDRNYKGHFGESDDLYTH